MNLATLDVYDNLVFWCSWTMSGGSLFWGLVRYYARRSWARWPTVRGVVRAAEANPKGIYSVDFAEGAGKLEERWEPMVFYEYLVGNKKYFGSRILPRGKFDKIKRVFNNKDLEKEFWSGYHADDAVEVHFNPLAPDEAFLILPRPTEAIAWGVGTALIVLILGSGYFVDLEDLLGWVWGD